MSDDHRILYWREAVVDAMTEAGILATEKQALEIARDLAIFHENYGLAFYQPANPLIKEVDELKERLKIESQKVTCRVCGGTGRERYYSGVWAVDSQCCKCNGEGKLVER